MKRRGLGLAFVLAVGGIALWWQSRQAQPTPNKTSTNRQFTDLDTALATELPGWKLHTPPPHPGPYRLLPESSLVVGDGKSGAICRVRDTSGAVVEELRLEGNPEFDQMVVRLETPSGRQTMAVLKRPRQPQGK
jgi:hypothetical protein